MATQPEPRAAPPAWAGEIEPVAGPPFLRMGTHASGDAWLTTTPDDAALLDEKRRVLAEHHDEAVTALPGTEPAAAAALAAVIAWRELREPGGVEPGPTPATAAVPPSAGPLDTAGRMVAEDLCLLVPGTTVGLAGAEGGWVLGAGSVCFPSHWRLRDKLGLPTAAIHGPVPHYADELAARVDRFLARLAPGRSVWRRNWTVHTSPELFVPRPAPPPEPPVTTRDAGGRLWLRSERQALVRLARHRGVLFTIRTDQAPLGALAADPALCARMAEAVASWSPRLLAYRGGEAVRRPLLGWLRAAALGSPPQA